MEEKDIEKMIQGAGRTCIFFHNSHLSQCVVEGKHPSLPNKWRHSLYKKFSVGIGLGTGQRFQDYGSEVLELNVRNIRIMLRIKEVKEELRYREEN